MPDLSVLRCTNCGERDAAGVNDMGDAECVECAMGSALGRVALEEFTARAKVALAQIIDYGRRLGLDPQEIVWSVEDAAEEVLAA